jgi:hypothetical protein
MLVLLRRASNRFHLVIPSASWRIPGIHTWILNHTMDSESHHKSISIFIVVSLLYHKSISNFILPAVVKI